MAEMKGEILTFKVSEEEAEMIRKAAKEEGLSVSRYIRPASFGIVHFR